MNRAPIPACIVPVPTKFGTLKLEALKFRACACLCTFAFLLAGGSLAHAQMVGINTGALDASFSAMDFDQIYLDTQNKEEQKRQDLLAQREKHVTDGEMSILDLSASNKALEQYNQAVTLLKEQKTQEAIAHLEKAIAAYPKFVLAHNTLGLAYADQQDPRARTELETAEKLDPKFPGSFFNLGMLSLSAKDYGSACSNLEKASALKAKDPKILAALAYAQNGNQQYEQSIATVQRLHAIEHRGLASVHYVSANSAMQLKDYDIVQRELTALVAEDPANPLAAAAQKNLDILAKRSAPGTGAAASQSAAAGQPQPVQTFPNSDRLKAELKGVENENSETGNAATGAAAPNPGSNTTVASARPPAATVPVYGGRVYTIRKAVDETALFFAVSSHGHMVSDLDLPDIRILDDSKPPERVLEFSPQSKLPLRLGFLIDTSGSVTDRFGFEKRAAVKFLQRILNPKLDLGFVAGFNTDTTVTQDFTADPAALSKGIEKLAVGGGTSLFDAVSFASWKLEVYPESERVARVLVILTDGEDNSSHRSLKQAIAAAEKAGVTIYTVSTVEKTAYTVSSAVDTSKRTDADRIVEVLGERTGGEGMFPGDTQTLDRSLDKLRDLIRSRYLVVYRPADFAPNGKFRAVHVTAERNHERMRVHVRKGYDARLEGQPSWWNEGQHWNHASVEGPAVEPGSQPATKTAPLR